MHAYTNFIKSVRPDSSTTDDVYFYVRMELALCRLQLCKQLPEIAGLKETYQNRFTELTAHIGEYLQTGMQQLQLLLLAEHQLRLIHIQQSIIDHDFEKEELDQLLGDINAILDHYDMRNPDCQNRTYLIGLSA